MRKMTLEMVRADRLAMRRRGIRVWRRPVEVVERNTLFGYAIVRLDNGELVRRQLRDVN